MLKSIAFHILKGGVGKTTLSGNIAYKISQTAKTIIIDCDIQANTSNWFLKEKADYELADCLQGIPLGNAIKKIKDNLYIIPTKSKDSLLKNYAETKLFQEPFIFEDLNTELQKLGFEYAIYDLSPSISQLERCILLAINEVITPITPEYFSFDGIELFYNELQKINKSYRKNTKYNKIIINLINKSFETHKQYLNILQDLKKYNIYKVGQDRKIADSQKYNQTIYEYYPKSTTIEELNKIANDIIGA
ncbi:ParA family protein [Brachyspira hyodysenteriae]|uniref:ParA family protein n=1 Tax=Brachyspira hyodysenteriae TaxID=159 RepID=UPI00063DA7FB|nr:ParA family protein [Brachyspira hyodysenteriae]KLI19202.1 plasmid partition protein [Brachyspira hyodysenteriae]MBT8721088.1 ParA family protein [Brachyspira hyodysenteriae]MBT8731338.1 ParA family protein [Brachyspira hyodysenteriae]MBT8733913.1 ParA family protein [Brachyspira hyodysenteriae]MBT8736483.1 ParA family protein [Brachyspira hyodysenteriae]